MRLLVVDLDLGVELLQFWVDRLLLGVNYTAVVVVLQRYARSCLDLVHVPGVNLHVQEVLALLHLLLESCLSVDVV